MSVPTSRFEGPAAALALRALASGKPPSGTNNGSFFFGRDSELALLERDLETVKAGRGAFRLIVGEHGAGKTALLDEMLNRARRARFVTMRSDISRDCSLWGREGEARSFLEQACLNMRTLGSGERCAVEAMIGVFRDECELGASDAQLSPAKIQRQRLAPLGELPRGHDFMHVLSLYADALSAGNEALEVRARRWLLAQHRTDAEARQDVSVAALGDCDLWSAIKLWARFAQLSGRAGLVLVIDELRLLADLTRSARATNYAQVFRMFNEIVQGQASGLSVLIAATPTMVSGDFNALCSEPGLGSCLHAGKAVGPATDAIEPLAIRLADLAAEDLELMLLELRAMIGEALPGTRLISPGDIPHFIEQSRDQLGGGREHPLPRDLIRQFLKLHNRLASSPNLLWADVLHGDIRSEGSFASVAASSGQYAERLM
jgi:hypothetical protein